MRARGEALCVERRGHAQDAQQPEAWYRRGVALERLRRFDDAGAAFERLLALPDPLITQWFSLPATPDDLGEFAHLIAALRSHHGLTLAEAAEGLETR